MAKPNARQLELINKMAIDPMTEDDVYVFRTIMIDDQETSYVSKIHPNLLRKFLLDASQGVGLMLAHDTEKLPVGRTFSAEIKEEIEEKTGYVKSLYGDVYIGLGRNTESGMSTDDIAKGISNGTIFDVSIGFSAEEFKCSCCGNDIRSWDCPHYPGKTYEIEEDGVVRNKRCEVIVGENGGGELRELSLVYAGACDRASIKRNLESYSVKSDSKSTILCDVENIKKIPLDTKVYMQFSKNGIDMFYGEKQLEEKTFVEVDNFEDKTEERSDFVDFLEIVKTKLSLDIETEDKFEEKLDEYVKSFQSLSEEKESLKTELEQLGLQKAVLEEQLSSLSTEKSGLEVEVLELKTKNEEFSVKQEEIRKELISKTLEAGIRAQGNSFQAELFEKFLSTLSEEEIKAVKEGFDKDFKDSFQKFSVTEDRTLKNRKNEPRSREDFETEHEFRTHVAEKALVYAKEKNVSLADATRFVMKDFSTKRSDN
jgi:hypothetical protein